VYFTKGGDDVTGAFLKRRKIFLSDFDILWGSKERTTSNIYIFFLCKLQGDVTEKTRPLKMDDSITD
jgi:hypothetical protein